jgi:hypothetical protein
MVLGPWLKLRLSLCLLVNSPQKCASSFGPGVVAHATFSGGRDWEDWV